MGNTIFLVSDTKWGLLKKSENDLCAVCYMNERQCNVLSYLLAMGAQTYADPGIFARGGGSRLGGQKTAWTALF